MNKITPLFCILILGLWGCRDSETTSAASVSSSATGPNAANAHIELANAEFYFNPTITIDATGISCTYDNTTNQLSIFPSGTTTCSITYSDSGDDLVLTLNESSGNVMGGKPLTLNLSAFVDKGGEGLIDEFMVQATHGTNVVRETGQFVGATKPLNKNVASKRSELPDMDGAPNKEEWNRYIVGNTIVAKHVDLSTGQSTSSIYDIITFINENQVSGINTDGLSYNGSYTYQKTSDAKGELINIVTWTNKDGTVEQGRYKIEVTFENFYHGNWNETESTDDGSLDQGTFDIYTDPSVLTKK